MKKWLLFMLVSLNLLGFGLKNRGLILLENAASASYDPEQRKKVADLYDDNVIHFDFYKLTYSKSKVEEYVRNKNLDAILAQNNKKFTQEKKDKTVQRIIDSYFKAIQQYSRETDHTIVEND